MSNRTLTWWEGPYDSFKIGNNGWNFQIAKSVKAGDAAPQSNVIWQSKALAPFAKISWKVQYALNWTATLPGAGVQVIISGDWQACDKGQVFDLDASGFWAPSEEPSKEGWLKVGNVGYKYPDVPGIHIVVGVLNATTGLYDPIFIDSAELPPGSSAVYQPQETVAWWLEGGNLTGQVYRGSRSRVTSKDFSNAAPSTNKYEWWTSYHFTSGKWSISETAPAGGLLAPPKSELLTLSEVGHEPVEVLLDPLGWAVLFGIAVAAELRPDLVNFLLDRLNQYFAGLNIRFVGNDGSNLSITYNARRGVDPGSLAAVVIGAGAGPKETINTALQGAKQSGKLVPNETWEISPKAEAAEAALVTQDLVSGST